MSALAAHLRNRATHDVAQLTPEERIRLALALGDDDVRLYCAATGVSPDAARRCLSDTRRLGRRASRAAAALQR
jgi:hypothetical protein